LLLAVVSMGWAWSGSAFPPGTLPFTHGDPHEREHTKKENPHKKKEQTKPRGRNSVGISDIAKLSLPASIFWLTTS